MSYRQYCRRYSEWADSKQLTFHIQRYPGVNLELDYAGKQLYLHNRRNPDETKKVTIFIAALTYSDYFYAEGMTECDIRNWIRVNNNEYSGPKWTIVRSESTAIKCLIGACHYLSILNNVKPASHHKVALSLTLLRMLSKVDKPINAGIHVRNVGTQFSGITVL